MKCNLKAVLAAAGVFALLLTSTTAAPMDIEEELSENNLVPRSDHLDTDMTGPWDSVDTAALRKLLLQLDAEEKLSGRVNRAWPQSEPRGWALRGIDGRMARQWRTDKRQVRFRQCYFNPISCFRK